MTLITPNLAGMVVKMWVDLGGVEEVGSGGVVAVVGTMVLVVEEEGVDLVEVGLVGVVEADLELGVVEVDLELGVAGVVLVLAKRGHLMMVVVVMATRVLPNSFEGGMVSGGGGGGAVGY